MFKKLLRSSHHHWRKGELDDSEELIDEIKIYQSLIGSMQWAVSLAALMSAHPS
jgi:hypothetical protein